MRIPVRTPLGSGTCACCSGRGSTTARGTGGHPPAWAAQGGHLEVLQWVRSNDATGEVWNEADLRRFATGPRKQEVLTWLDGLTAP